jgi:hypothetical protein
MREKKIEVRLSGDELARLEELRAGGSRSAAIRALIRGAGGVAAAPEPTHGEILQVLAAMARDGKVAAAVALERALRETADDAPDDFFPDWLRD